MANFAKLKVLGTTIDVATEDIADIVDTALYGGITYWAMGADKVGESRGNGLAQHVANGGTLLLRFIEEDDNGALSKELTRDMILKGIKTWVDEGGDLQYAITPAGIDTACIDASDADSIIQCALYGDVIYG